MTNPSYTINAASDILERNRRAVARAVRNVEPDEIKAGQKRWRMSTIFKAFEATYHQPQQPSDKAWSNARTRKAAADADTAEFVNEVKRGEWCRTSEVLELMTVENLMMRENFIGVSGKIADSLHLIDRDAAYLIVKDAIYDCLNRIASGDGVFRLAIELVERAGGKPKLMELLKGYQDLRATCVEVDEAEKLQKARELAAPRKSPTVAELADSVAGLTGNEIHEIIRDEWHHVVQQLICGTSSVPGAFLSPPVVKSFADALAGRDKKEINAIFRTIWGLAAEALSAEQGKVLARLSDPNAAWSHNGWRGDGERR
jgi:hypothetical protein